jgi:phosphoribosylformylglycinamidine synthase
MDLKEAGDIVFILGQTRNEFGGSHYGLILGEEWGEAPAPAPQGPELARRLHAAIRAGLVRACHDCSEGGLAVAAAEMCIAGRLGLQLDIGRAPLDSDVTRTDLALFAESNSRYIVEVTPANADAFDAMLTGLPHARVGNVVAEPYLRILGLQGEEAVRAPISELVYAWTDQSYARPKLLAPGPG